MFVAKRNKIISRFLLVSSLVILLGSCSLLHKEPHPPHFIPWSIYFTGPSQSTMNGVWLKMAYGENDKENWRHHVHTGSYGRGGTRMLHNLQKALKKPNYEGYGIPLGNGRDVSYSAKQVGLSDRSLPDRLYITWVSNYSNIEYGTLFHVSDALKEEMKVPFYPSWYRGLPCYKSEFSIAFLPNGTAKVWITGCDRYAYVGEVAPFRERQLKIVPGSDTMKRMTAMRLKGPIPWDKVNKIWLGPRAIIDSLSGRKNIEVE